MRVRHMTPDVVVSEMGGAQIDRVVLGFDPLGVSSDRVVFRDKMSSILTEPVCLPSVASPLVGLPQPGSVVQCHCCPVAR